VWPSSTVRTASSRNNCSAGERFAEVILIV
jgi:hypothetical protein